jgi:hypothetical protein
MYRIPWYKMVVEESKNTYSISAMMTLHPSSAKRFDIASPNPLPPPVTIATLP